MPGILLYSQVFPTTQCMVFFVDIYWNTEFSDNELVNPVYSKGDGSAVYFVQPPEGDACA